MILVTRTHIISFPLTLTLAVDYSNAKHMLHSMNLVAFAYDISCIFRDVSLILCAVPKRNTNRFCLPNHVQRLDHFSPLSLSLFLSVPLVAHQQLTKWNKPSYNYQHEYDTFFPFSPPKNAVDNDLLAEDHPPIAEIKCKQHRIMNFFLHSQYYSPKKPASSMPNDA